MSPKIYNIKEPLDLDRIHLAKPTNKNGSHFIKTLDIDNPIYFLGPKCFTKQGFVKSGKKYFCDFVFCNEDSEFLSWLENLEEISRKRIYENSENWFETPLDQHDIESSMSPPYKSYKSGKYFIVRANVPTALEKINIKVYDENEKETDPENIKENTKVLAVFEFQGIRCNVRSFQFEIELKQLLIVEPEKLFEKCIIGHRNVATKHDDSPTKQMRSASVSLQDPPLRLENHSIPTLVPRSGIAKTLDTLDRPFLGNEEAVDLSSVKNAGSDVGDVDVQGFSEQESTTILNEQNPTNLPFSGKEDKISDSPNPLSSFSGLSSSHNQHMNDVVEIDPTLPIEILDIDFPLENTSDENNVDDAPLKLKSRNDVYYKLYKEIRQRAKEAKREALANYLEAKRIKNTYLLEDLSDSDSELDE